MTTLEQSKAEAGTAWARGFACPHEQLDTALVDDIATTYASAYAGIFVERFGSDLERASSGLLPLLGAWAARESSFDEIWETSLGYMRRVVLDDDLPRALQHSAAAALRLNALGEEGEWQITLAEPARLRLERWLLPRARSISTRAENGEIEIETTDADSPPCRVRFERHGESWQVEGADRLPAGRYAGCDVTLLPQAALDGLHFGGEISLSRLSTDQIMAKIAKSIWLLRDYAPEYLPWTRHVLRAVVPLHAQLSEIRSGSDTDKPGVIQASFPIRTVALAETWVHECSHQYFQILTRVGPVVDGTDPTLYYSPVRQTGRPLDKILLAYHAFANVLLFYRSCAETGMHDPNGYLEINELRLIPQLRQLEEPLRSTRGLTELGSALWEPLGERIAL
jgi:HEXXH motif-containing protein